MPKQMKGGSFRVMGSKRAGHANTTAKYRQPSRMLFKPANPQPVIDYMKGIHDACEGMADESERERKDRLIP